MAPYGFQVTLDTDWRGGREEFSNVFHYDLDQNANDAGYDAVSTSLVTILRTCYATGVNFKRVRVYGPTDGPKADNIMRLVKDLGGAGSLTTASNIPREMAIVGQIFVGRGPNGGKQYLRKYFHAGGLPNSAAGTPATLGNDVLSGSDKTPFSTAMGNLKNIGGQAATQVAWCTPNGKHMPVAAPVEILPHLHVRQFRR